MPSDRLQLVLDIGHQPGIGEDLIISFLPVLYDFDDLQVGVVYIFDQFVLDALGDFLFLHFYGLAVVEDGRGSALLGYTAFPLGWLRDSGLIEETHFGFFELAKITTLVWIGFFLLDIHILAFQSLRKRHCRTSLILLVRTHLGVETFFVINTRQIESLLQKFFDL